MPYLVSSIIAIVTALIILMTRYEADDSQITAEIERAKSMFLTIDGFVNTYIQSGGDLQGGEVNEAYRKLNFATLYKNGILIGSISKNEIKDVSLDDTKTAENETNKAKFFESKLEFQKSKILWQLVPIVTGDKIKDSSGADKNLDSSAGSGYKLFVDFSKEGSLMSKDAFSENFFGREICEKRLFGSFVADAKSIVSSGATLNQINIGGTNNDGLFACIVYK